VRTLVDYRPALRSRTGVGEYVHELSRALVRTSGDAPDDTLILFSSSWADRLDPHVVPGARTIDLRVPVRMLNYAWHRWGFPAVEQLSGVSIDVVHSMHPLLLPSSRAAQVVTIHDLDFLDHPERTSAEIRRDYPSLARRHAHRADRVVAVSKFTASDVERRLGVPREKISICSPGAPDWTRRLADPAAGYFLFLGTLEPRKNIATLIEAYARLRALRPEAPRLVLAGGVTEAVEPLLKRIAEPPLAGFVDTPGYIDADQRQKLYHGAIALIMPALLEGFGIPALEAMTIGVPVIAANRGALPEVTGDAGLLFDPKQPDELAAALARVMDDAPLRRGMRDRGWARAANYSWDATATRTREAWHLAIDERRRRRGAARG
jgi:glycosyltransferase involved in cell wall biosynthesis